MATCHTIDNTPRWVLILIAVIGAAVLLTVCIATLVIVALNEQRNAEASATTTNKMTVQTTSTTTTTISSGMNVVDQLSTSLQNISSYPNGSYIVSISSSNYTMDNSSNITSLLPLDQNMLFGLGGIDNSSFIFEAGRQQNLYFRVSSSFVSQILSSPLSLGMGIQFGSNVNSLVVVPFSTLYSGIILLPNSLSDGSRVFALIITIPPSICSQIADSCTGLTYNVYLLLNSSTLSAPISYQINVACGDVCSLPNVNVSSCSASCGATCDANQVAGADTPVSRRYYMGAGTTSFQFTYQTYGKQDRVKVWNGDTNLLDSGCVGTQTEVTVTLNLTSTNKNIRVDVEPNCTGGTGTAWYFIVACPNN